jgi:hypothetical protein
MKNGVFRDVTPCGSCKNDVSEELSASIIRVTRIGELGTLAVNSNLRTLRRNNFEGGAKFLRNVGSYRTTRSNIPEDNIFQHIFVRSFVRISNLVSYYHVSEEGAKENICTKGKRSREVCWRERKLLVAQKHVNGKGSGEV